MDTDESDTEQSVGVLQGTNVCDRCGDEYEKYLVFVRDNFSDIVDHVRNRYENLCKPCRVYLEPKSAFTGAADVEPKTEAEIDG